MRGETLRAYYSTPACIHPLMEVGPGVAGLLMFVCYARTNRAFVRLTVSVVGRGRGRSRESCVVR